MRGQIYFVIFAPPSPETAVQQISPSLYQIGLGAVNTFVLTDPDGLTLIDAGLPGSKDKIFAAIRKGGKDPAAIRRLILTHCHPDHAGGAAEIQQATGARVYAHADDAPPIEQGAILGRPRHRTPGIVHWIVYQLFIKPASHLFARVPVDEKLHDGDVLPLGGGLEVIHTPGHSAGHIALLLRNEGVLIAGDICANMMGLDYSTVYENREMGRQSILKAAGFAFDQVVFGHGKPLTVGANQKLREKFATA